MDYKKIKINLDTMDKVKRFIKTARSFMSDIDIMTNRACVDAKSVLGVYALDLSQDTYVRIVSDSVEEKRNFCAVMEDFR